MMHKRKWFLGVEKLPVAQHVEFSEHQCTEDHTTYLAQELEDKFERKKQTLVVGIDL